ncbi:MAG TPA: glycosyltransferase [Saprospiraceae bacterium]|nr:glycosyltransferase [Saprospiraceae bacterium]
MKVLHITASYKPAYIYGGPVFSISALTEALAQNGVGTDVYTTTANGHENLKLDTSKTYRIDGVSVKYSPRYLGGLFFSPKLMKDLWKHCKIYDVVHIHSWWNFVSIFACVVCLIRCVTPVLSLRGTMSDFSFDNKKVWVKKLFHECVGSFLLKRCNIHFTSAGELANARRWFSPARYFILRNITVIPPVSQSGTETHNSFELVFLGRLHPIKNLEILIDAIKGLDLPCRLKIYGQGDPDYVKRLKSRAGENVQWMGWVEGEEKFKALRDADIFVLISQYENFGNVLVEALSQGTAVICARGIGISDFVEEKDLGWTVIPEVEEVRKTLSYAKHDIQKRNRIRETAPRIVDLTFSAHALGGKYAEEYQKNYAHANPIHS